EERAARPRGWPSRVLLILVAAAAVVVLVTSALGGHDDKKKTSDTGDEIDIPDAVDAVPTSVPALPAIAWADDTGVVARFEGTNPTHIEAEAGCCVAWSDDGEYLAYRQGDTISIRHREQVAPVIRARQPRMTWSPTAPLLAVAWFDGDGAHVDLVDARTGAVTRVI